MSNSGKTMRNLKLSEVKKRIKMDPKWSRLDVLAAVGKIAEQLLNEEEKFQESSKKAKRSSFSDEEWGKERRRSPRGVSTPATAKPCIEGEANRAERQLLKVPMAMKGMFKKYGVLGRNKNKNSEKTDFSELKRRENAEIKGEGKTEEVFVAEEKREVVEKRIRLKTIMADEPERAETDRNPSEAAQKRKKDIKDGEMAAERGKFDQNLSWVAPEKHKNPKNGEKETEKRKIDQNSSGVAQKKHKNSKNGDMAAKRKNTDHNPSGVTQENQKKLKNAETEAEREKSDKNASGVAQKNKNKNKNPKNGDRKYSKRDGPQPPPEMPAEFRNKIIELAEGKEVSKLILVVQKRLEETDISPRHSRFSVPRSKMRGQFLTESERNYLDENRNFPVRIIEPDLTPNTMTLTRWSMSSNLDVLNGSWNGILKRFDLKKGMIMQLYSFRVENELWFAFVRLS